MDLPRHGRCGGRHHRVLRPADAVRTRTGGTSGLGIQPVGRKALLRRSDFGGDDGCEERQSAERHADRHRQHASGLLARPGIPHRHGHQHGLEVRRRRPGRRKYAASGFVRHPAPGLRKLRRGRVCHRCGLQPLDWRCRRRSGLNARGNHPGARRPEHGRLPVGRSARGTLRIDPIGRRHADPQPGCGRVYRRRALAVDERRRDRCPPQPCRGGARAGFQPQYDELLHHRGGDRVRRGRVRSHQRCALCDRHLAQRRRPCAGFRTHVVQPQRPRAGRTTHHGHRGRARRRLPVGQTGR